MAAIYHTDLILFIAHHMDTVCVIQYKGDCMMCNAICTYLIYSVASMYYIASYSSASWNTVNYINLSAYSVVACVNIYPKDITIALDYMKIKL